MILTITTTHKPATDLGFLLMKHPDNVHTKKLPFGQAHLFYPEATEDRCTAALMLDTDPVGLVRGFKTDNRNSLFDHYVTDRPYAVSSFMSVAISRLLGTAMGGKSRARQELADQEIPFEIGLSPIPSRGGSQILNDLFEPLGYSVESEQLPLDETYPDWGNSPYHRLILKGTQKLRTLLTHLFVLIPVLDNQKHYWVGADEVEKLLAKGEGWLEDHPKKDLIALRYLKHRRGLTRWALEQLEDKPDDVASDEEADAAEEEIEKPVRLNDLRMEKVVEVLKDKNTNSVADLGCGEGRLINHLMKEPSFKRILGIDVSSVILERAKRRLNIERLTPRQKERLTLALGSFIYVDERLSGFDAITCIEVIEHMELDRLSAFEHTVFKAAKPRHVIVTTPNIEYNQLFENMTPGKLRHGDHRFEWTCAEFENWANSVAERNGYGVEFSGIGELHEEHGTPTQMGVFSR